MADRPSTVAPSLSRLAIDRSAVAPRRRRPLWKRWWVWTIALIVLAAVALFIGRRNAPQAVEIATVARASILLAFLIESLLLALVGGLIGLIAASFLTVITISTTNFQSFSELAFAFTLTPSIVVSALVFSLVMGFVGGFLPAIKASRMKIVDALRAD